MIKINKKLILLLVLMLVMSGLGGCSSNKLPEGIESKTFFKDLNKGYELLLDSMANNTYYEDDINKLFEKMNEVKYKEKLNVYEISIIESLNSNLDSIKKDLTTGKKVIQSTTLKDIEWVFEIMNNYWEENN